MQEAREKGTVYVMEQKVELTGGILKSLKGEILKEFEKVCPTDMSFQRIKKDMHDKFDAAERQLFTK